MSKVIRFLASPMLMAFLIIAFAVSSAIATFIENDFGTQAARAIIYNAWWFELIMLLLATNFLTSVFTRKLYSKEKFAVMLFHIGFVIILLGAAVTRYFGHEGMMHIREGQTATSYTSSEKWLKGYLGDDEVWSKEVNFTPVSRNRFSKSFWSNKNKVKVSLTDYIPHAIETVVEHFDGHPVVSLVVMDSIGSKPALVLPGKVLPVGITGLGFTTPGKRLDVELTMTDSGVVARSTYPVSIRKMNVDEELTVQANSWFKLSTHTFYSSGRVQFAYRGHWPKAKIRMVYNPDPSVHGNDVLAFNVDVDGVTSEVFVPLASITDNPVYEEVGGVKVGLKFGPRSLSVPFGIKLNDFILERYPGSDSPSSFMSNVTVIDKDNDTEMPFSIYMNNILNYRGYRFYQSSYDPDERGTYLSVNKDFWGTAITYFGYFILIVGILWALIAPGSRFRKLISRPSSVAILLFFLFTSTTGFSQNAPTPNADHAREFGKLMVQDQGGRMKPLSKIGRAHV